MRGSTSGGLMLRRRRGIFDRLWRVRQRAGDIASGVQHDRPGDDRDHGRDRHRHVDRSVKAAPACSASAAAADGSSDCDTPSRAPTDSLAALAASGGSCDTSTLLRYADATMLPRMAMPSAPPSSRVVSLTADPTPALLSGTDDMIVPVAGGIVSAMPPASITSATTMRPYGVSGARNVKTTNPAAIPVNPARRPC